MKIHAEVNVNINISVLIHPKAFVARSTSYKRYYTLFFKKTNPQ